MATPVSACAEASCAGVIRTARDVVADVGEEAAKKSEGLVELSRKRPSNGERDCHRLMAKRVPSFAASVQKHFGRQRSCLAAAHHKFQRMDDLFCCNRTACTFCAGLLRLMPGDSLQSWRPFGKDFDVNTRIIQSMPVPLVEK